MSISFLLAACAFAAVLGALVACIDRWRESRLVVARPVTGLRAPARRVAVPTQDRRAA